MSFRPEEVSAILQKELERTRPSSTSHRSAPCSRSATGSPASGALRDAMAGELLKFPGDVTGMVLNLEEDNVGVVLFGDDERSRKATWSSAPAIA